MTPTVTRDDAISAVVDGFQEEDDSKKLAESEAELAKVEVDGRQAFYRLRSDWSAVVQLWISVLITFNIVLTLLVGTRTLSFVGHEWFITAVTVETFLQIVGLGYVAVRFLFSSGSQSK